MRSGRAAPGPGPSKLRVFFRRLLSSLVLWTIVLMALFSSNRLVSDYVFLVIMVLLAASGLAEFYGLAARLELQAFVRLHTYSVGPRTVMMVSTHIDDVTSSVHVGQLLLMPTSAERAS